MAAGLGFLPTGLCRKQQSLPALKRRREQAHVYLVSACSILLRFKGGAFCVLNTYFVQQSWRNKKTYRGDEFHRPSGGAGDGPEPKAVRTITRFVNML